MVSLLRKFTLVNFSIAIIIIGLLLSTLIFTRNLSSNAENRALVAQIQKYNVAVKTFIYKYDCVPGDCKNAKELIGSMANGNGDGLVYDVQASGAPELVKDLSLENANEIGLFFYELGLANLLREDFTPPESGSYKIGINFPILRNKQAGIIVYASKDWHNYYYLGIASNDSGNITTQNALSPITAFYIDTKLDDGLGATGNIQAFGGNYLEGPVKFSPTLDIKDNTSCLSGADSTSYFIVNSDAITCQLRIKLI